MAYYAWDSAHEPVQPVTPVPGSTVSGLGAYYAWDSAHEPVVPISGLGDSGAAKIADDAVRARIDTRRPLAVVGEWAIQHTDNVWQDTTHQTALTLLPLTDSDLNQARHAGFGAEAQVVGVFYPRPKRQADQAYAFVGTPYAAGTALAVYSVTDSRPVAVPMFLTLATLRDLADEDRGSRSVARAAAALGGGLVYVISLSKAPGQRAPGARFQEVFNQIGLSAAEPLPPTEAPAPAATSTLSLVPWFLGGTLAAGALWWFVGRR